MSASTPTLLPSNKNIISSREIAHVDLAFAGDPQTRFNKFLVDYCSLLYHFRLISYFSHLFCYSPSPALRALFLIRPILFSFPSLSSSSSPCLPLLFALIAAIYHFCPIGRQFAPSRNSWMPASSTCRFQWAYGKFHWKNATEKARVAKEK